MIKTVLKRIAFYAALAVTLLHAETAVSTPTIIVSGIGVVYQTPDIAFVDFIIQTSSPSAEASRDSNGLLFTKVSKVLEKAGVSKQNIILQPLSLFSVDYQQGNLSKQELCIRKFRINIPIVSYPDTKRIYEVSDAIASTGAMLARQPVVSYQNADYADGLSYTGVTYSVGNSTALGDSARALSIKNAEEKARWSAKKQNMKIKRLTSLNVGDPAFNIVPTLSVTEEGMVGKIKCMVYTTAYYEIE